MAKPKALPYYNFDKVYSYNALFMFIVGARGLGKTYGSIKRSIHRYLKHGEQFIYLRRYKPEIVASKATFFTAVSAEFPEYEFRVNGNEGQIRPTVPDDEKNDAKWETICFFAVLSTAQSLKGASFANVYTIIFDEFIIEKGHNHYLPNESVVFNNFFLTVDRFQDRTRALFLANAVSIVNPYFLAYDIKPWEKDELITTMNGDIVVHFPDASAFADAVYKTRFGRFIKDTEYADYSIGNEFADANDHLIGNKSSQAAYLFTIKAKSGTVSIWHDIFRGNVFAQEKRPRKEQVYVLDPLHMTEDRMLLEPNSFYLKHLRSAFSRGLLFFDTPRSRNAVLDALK